jgi:transcriptional regulator with XRE-family HTH domain
MQADPQPLRQTIGETVRRLRKGRRWTLAELARHLDVSESRLSELERGAGSFSAEHLLTVFRLFHVGPQDFIPPDDAPDPELGSLQTALVKFGARHLVADERTIIRWEHDRPIRVVEEVLLRHPTARWLTALPPVLVTHLAEIPLPAVQHTLAQAGVPHRWGWLLDQLLEALRVLGPPDAPLRWRQDCQRAQTVAAQYLPSVQRPTPDAAFDLLDPDLRTAASVAAAIARATPIDHRWRVLSRLTTDDFLSPLEVAGDAD